MARVPGGDGWDDVAVEEPLEIRVNGAPAAVTMRTPGQDLDLAAGFLWTEGVIDGADDLRALAVVAENVVDAVLAEGVPANRARLADRAAFASSACGICGVAGLERLRRSAAPRRALVHDFDAVTALPARLRAAQAGFALTGGLHAAALVVGDELCALREDVGRHNAVDKVLGARLREDALPLDAIGLFVTSRAGYEIVAKALVAGVGWVAAIGAPTSLAVQAATAAGLPLWAWVRPDRATRYA